jgi:PAS domain S-box-containing protein
MRDRRDGPGQAARLRWEAEEAAKRNTGLSPRDPKDLSYQEAQQLIHELRVHQIELKMQNEELRRVEAELEATRAHYFDLYDLAPVGYCILSGDGLILEANLTAVALLGTAKSTLIRQPITRFILKEDQDVYYLHRRQLFEFNAPHVCELRMVKKDGTSFWARLSATPPRAAGGSDDAPVNRLVLSDISDRKRVEMENANLLAQLKQTRPSGRSSFKT